jgi:ADP-ribose pyrophosphatase YjhB (NUDIX family)
MSQSENLFPIVAVNAIIFTDSSHFILTRRVDNNLWCLPGGIIEFGETVEEAVIREVKEEIRVKCILENLVGIYSANNKKDTLVSKRSSIILAFRCRILEGEPGVSEEVAEVGLFTLNNLPQDIIENQRVRIIHAVTNKERSYIL